MEPAIFFAEPPNFDELCCITVSVHMTEGLCVMQPHIVRCREVIFTEPNVLASPVFDMDASFNIVLQQSLFRTGQLQTRLQKKGMQIGKPYRVYPGIYQACLTYTILARLSPVWNKAGDWVIQGRDFINHEGYTNAIKMNVNVNREEVYIALLGTAIRFPPLQVEDLNLSRSEMLAILRSTEGMNWPVDVDNAWCHVLPSMKRGKIASVALTIPKESPFPSYKELKRHWKNMYGYRLPDTDEDILYCQIGFLSSGGGKHFTYPSVCLRAAPCQVVQRVDPKPVLTAFLQDLHARVGVVCGTAMRFQPRLRYATPALHSSAQPPAKVNLSSKPLNKPIGPLRDDKNMSNLYNRQNTRTLTLIERLTGQGEHRANISVKNPESVIALQKDCSGSTSAEHLAMRTKQNSCESTDPELDEEKTLKSNSTVEKKSHVLLGSNVPSTHQQYVSNSSEDIRQDRSGISTPKKFVPLFRPKMKPVNFQKSNKSSSQSIREQSSEQGLKCFIPSFKSQIIQKLCTSSFSKMTNTSSLSTSTQPDKIMSSQLSKPTFLNRSQSGPVDTPQHSKLFSCNDKKVDNLVHRFEKPQHCIAASQSSALNAPIFSQRCKPLSQQSVKSKPGFIKSQANISTHKAGEENSGMGQCAPSSAKVDHHQIPALNPGDTVSEGVLTPRSHPIKPTSSSTPFSAWANMINDEDDFDCLIGTPTSTPTPIGNKRKIESEAESTPKKPRAKPQVQNVDVENLARAHQLGKVNTVTLLAWLRERNVVCKAKDKKSDLVEKVNAYLTIAQSEQ